MKTNFTRGRGLLENFLSRKRAEFVDRLIPDHLRSGKLLDLGCGFYPHFLSRVQFQEKFGLDRDFSPAAEREFDLVRADLRTVGSLPFPDQNFEIVTALAVLEHLDGQSATKIIKDVHRILKPGGLLIITVPSGWSDWLLKVMARLGLVSAVEIGEHQQKYSPDYLVRQIVSGNFEAGKVAVRRFELGLNLSAIAKK